MKRLISWTVIVSTMPDTKGVAVTVLNSCSWIISPHFTILGTYSGLFDKKMTNLPSYAPRSISRKPSVIESAIAFRLKKSHVSTKCWHNLSFLTVLKLVMVVFNALRKSSKFETVISEIISTVGVATCIAMRLPKHLTSPAWNWTHFWPPPSHRMKKIMAQRKWWQIKFPKGVLTHELLHKNAIKISPLKYHDCILFGNFTLSMSLIEKCTSTPPSFGRMARLVWWRGWWQKNWVSHLQCGSIWTCFFLTYLFYERPWCIVQTAPKKCMMKLLGEKWWWGGDFMYAQKWSNELYIKASHYYFIFLASSTSSNFSHWIRILLQHLQFKMFHKLQHLQHLFWLRGF